MAKETYEFVGDPDDELLSVVQGFLVAYFKKKAAEADHEDQRLELIDLLPAHFSISVTHKLLGKEKEFVITHKTKRVLKGDMNPVEDYLKKQDEWALDVVSTMKRSWDSEKLWALAKEDKKLKKLLIAAAKDEDFITVTSPSQIKV